MITLLTLETLGSVVLLAADAPEGGPLSLIMGPLFPFIIIGILFYLLLIRPERRKRADMTKLLDTIKKNDRVVTIGGVFGVVVNAPTGAEDITIRVDDNNNIRLRILRSAVSRVVTAESDIEKKDTP